VIGDCFGKGFHAEAQREMGFTQRRRGKRVSRRDAEAQRGRRRPAGRQTGTKREKGFTQRRRDAEGKVQTCWSADGDKDGKGFHAETQRRKGEGRDLPVGRRGGNGIPQSRDGAGGGMRRAAPYGMRWRPYVIAFRNELPSVGSGLGEGVVHAWV